MYSNYWGGYGASMWYFHDTYPAEYSYHLPGCTGSALASLDLTKPWTRAWLGRTMSVDVSWQWPLSPTSFVVLAMGLTDQSFGGVQLPISGFGLPNCQLAIAPEATQVSIGSNSVALFQIPIPSTATLVGIPFWQQGFVVDPASGGLFVPTNSTQGTVGKSQ